MSEQSLLAVRQRARAKGSARLVLMIYACYAHDDGTGACPGPQTVADETGLKLRTVYELIVALEEDGELVYEGMSSYRTRSFTVRPGGVRSDALTARLFPARVRPTAHAMHPAAHSVRPDAQTVRYSALESVVVDSSLEENQLDWDGNTTTDSSAPGRTNHATERTETAPPSPALDQLGQLLAYHGFAEPARTDLARRAVDDGLVVDDLKLFMIQVRRLQAQGKVADWHGYTVDGVKRDGWGPLMRSVSQKTERVDARPPTRAPNQARRSALAEHLAFFQETA